MENKKHCDQIVERIEYNIIIETFRFIAQLAERRRELNQHTNVTITTLFLFLKQPNNNKNNTKYEKKNTYTFSNKKNIQQTYN